MDETSRKSLELHEKLHGKIEVVARAKAETNEDLALLYTPGVAEPCRQIQADYQKSWELTRRGNLVAVITDGTAVLGLGDIGPAAGMPVMEASASSSRSSAMSMPFLCASIPTMWTSSSRPSI